MTLFEHEHSKARRGFEPRSTDSESVVLTATPTSRDKEPRFYPVYIRLEGSFHPAECNFLRARAEGVLFFNYFFLACQAGRTGPEGLCSPQGDV